MAATHAVCGRLHTASVLQARRSAPLTAPLPVFRRASLGRRSRLSCEASYSKKTDKKAEVPGVGLPLEGKPLDDDAADQQPSTSEPAATSTTDSNAQASMSQEEMSKLANLYRAQKNDQQTNPVQGVIDEVRLIEWPTPKTALFNTVLVTVIVLTSSLTLFAMNTLLADVANKYYGLGGISGLINNLTE